MSPAPAGARTPRRVLVVSWPYPPVPSVGGNRWLAITRHLREWGHDVTILTTSMFGARPEDGPERVVRTYDLAGGTVVRKLLSRPALGNTGGEGPPAETEPPALLSKVLVPDAWVASWVPFAAAAARRLVRERAIECVITTVPYESAHLIPFVLGRRRPAWVADFRDGWSFEPHRPPFPTAPQRALDAWLERQVVLRADRVLAATLPIAEDFRARYGIDAAHVPNGWDPAVAPEAAPADLPVMTPERVTLLHTGTLGEGWRVPRDPRPLLEALRTLAAEHPRVAERFELVLVGRVSAQLEALVQTLGIDGLVRFTGPVSRAAALAAQRQADALLLITAPSSRGEATGKLFEYLGAGRPILALASGNEAARIIHETGTGVTVPPGDSDQILAALLRLVSDGLGTVEQLPASSPYVYPAPALLVEREVERAIAQRGRRATA